MDKYINADQFERDCMFDKECEDMQDVIYKLRDYPPADVVEVVRCEDCKKFRNAICRKFMICTDLTDYCSYGERKETE